MSGERCVLNGCEKPKGVGTWCSVAGLSRPQPVCEEHWLVLRELLIASAMPARAAPPAVPESGPLRTMHAELHRVLDRYGCVGSPCELSVDAADVLRALSESVPCPHPLGALRPGDTPDEPPYCGLCRVPLTPGVSW